MTRNVVGTRLQLLRLETRLVPGELLFNALRGMPEFAYTSSDTPVKVADTRIVSRLKEDARNADLIVVIPPVTAPTAESSPAKVHTDRAPVTASEVLLARERGYHPAPAFAAAAHAASATEQMAPILTTAPIQQTGALATRPLASPSGTNQAPFATIQSRPVQEDRSGGRDEVRGVTGSDSGNSIVMDLAGNSIITGSYWNGTDTDVFVSKVTSSGSVVFTRVLPNPGPDSGNAIAIDARGNVFVAGSRSTATGDVDAFLAKFNRGGILITMNTIANPGPDSANGVAIGAGNNGYMTGSFWNGSDSDFFISRFAANTVISCSFVYPNPGTDAGNAVGIDSASNAYVTGTFSFFADNYLYLAKFDPTCSLLNGTYILNTGPNAGNGIAVNAVGEGYITGSYWNGTDSDFIIARFDAAGAFPNSFVYPNPGADRGNAVVFDGAFNAYVTGAFTFGTDVYVFVAIFDSTCTLLNGGYIFHVGEDRGMDIALGFGGNSFVTGAFDNGDFTDAFVAQFDPALVLVNQTFIPNPN